MDLTFQRPRLEGYFPSRSATRAMHSNSPKQQGASALDVTAMTSGMKLGDESAFRTFYDAYCDRLYRYLIVLTRGQEDSARELLQTTLIKVARCIKTFADEASLWNWLAAVARNNFLDHLRKAQRRPVIIPFFADDPEVDIPQEVPQDDSSLQELLVDCLRGMAPEDRLLLEQFYFEEASHQKLAMHAGSTPKAIESKLARLRDKLRKTFFHRLKHER